MRARFALVVFTTALLLTGCDLFNSEDSVSGYWEGVSEFRVDTVLAAQNARITADYRMHFAFDLVHDDGLITGRVRSTREGYIVYREAGYPADTLRFSANLVTDDHEARGTFVEPDLEFDVPDGPYEEDMWTFDVTGSRAETENYIRHLWTFTRKIDGETFDFGIRSKEKFKMTRKSKPDEDTEAGDGAVQGSVVSADLRSMGARSE